MTKSEEWDKREKDFLMPWSVTPKQFEGLEKAYHLYQAHRKQTCKGMKATVNQQGKILELYCRDCEWNYCKKWWKF